MRSYCEIRGKGVSSKRNFLCLEVASAIRETHCLEIQKALLLQLYGKLRLPHDKMRAQETAAAELGADVSSTVHTPSSRIYLAPIAGMRTIRKLKPMILFCQPCRNASQRELPQ